jgi:HPt (histidine-containing phosphotransfer) domain-containing protein
VSFEGSNLVDWAAFSKARVELGAGFARMLGYFREDGVKSVAAIESAMRAQNAAGMVLPAHTLKGEARQFGATPLADLAEAIEMLVRDALERRETPDAVLEEVVQLRPLFTATLALLEREANPLAERRAAAGFGRRPAAGPSGQQ